MKILHLTLKKKWFDMIASGEKTEEYREIKAYWANRLNKKFDLVRFRNGYSKNAPVLTVKIKRIVQGFGKKEWGAPDFGVYIIELGEKVESK